MKLGITDTGTLWMGVAPLLEELWIPDCYTYLSGNFRLDGVSNLRHVHVGKGIKELYLVYCTELEEIYVPGNVKKTVNQGFAFCSKLKKIIIDEGFEEACPGTFTWTGAKLIDMPSTTKRIDGYHTFYCTENPILILRAAVPPVTDSELHYLTAIYVPDNSVNAYKSAKVWGDYADKIRPLSEYQP